MKKKIGQFFFPFGPEVQNTLQYTIETPQSSQ